MSGKLYQITKSKLLSYVKKGLTDEEIGAMYSNASRQAVFQLRKKFGIKSNRARNKQRNINIRKEHEKGMSPSLLTKRYGLSTSQVYRILKGV